MGTSEMHRLKLRFTWLVHLFRVKAPPPKASHSDSISTESVKNGWKSSQSRNKWYTFLVALWESFAFQMRCSVWGYFIQTRIYSCSSFRFFPPLDARTHELNKRTGKSYIDACLIRKLIWYSVVCAITISTLICRWESF